MIKESKKMGTLLGSLAILLLAAVVAVLFLRNNDIPIPATNTPTNSRAVFSQAKLYSIASLIFGKKGGREPQRHNESL